MLAKHGIFSCAAIAQEAVATGMMLRSYTVELQGKEMVKVLHDGDDGDYGPRCAGIRLISARVLA